MPAVEHVPVAMPRMRLGLERAKVRVVAGHTARDGVEVSRLALEEAERRVAPDGAST